MLVDFVDAMFNTSGEMRYKTLEMMLLVNRNIKRNNASDMLDDIIARTLQIIQYDSDEAVRNQAFTILGAFSTAYLRDNDFSDDVIKTGATNMQAAIFDIMTQVAIDEDTPLALRARAMLYNASKYYKGTLPYLVYLASNAEDEDVQAVAAVYAFRTSKRDMDARIGDMMPKLLSAFNVDDVSLNDVTGALWKYKNDPRVKPAVLERLKTAKEREEKTLNRMLDNITD